MGVKVSCQKKNMLIVDVEFAKVKKGWENCNFELITGGGRVVVGGYVTVFFSCANL